MPGMFSWIHYHSLYILASLTSMVLSVFTRKRWGTSDENDDYDPKVMRTYRVFLVQPNGRKIDFVTLTT